MKAAVVGIAGTQLRDDERALFRDHPPAGVILFRRNVADPAQLATLTAALRDVLPTDAVLMVDQEGGRVVRLRPPHWRAHPPAGVHPSARAAWLTGALIGAECAASGLRAVCAPVLDLFVAGASSVVGDRAWSADPPAAAERAGALAAGLCAAGCIAIGKHAPGHGRAQVDSHHGLPRIVAGIDLSADLAVFRACAPALPWMMTAHIVYDRWDAEHPATWSPIVVQDVIRGAIGFAGVLISDDLAMGALWGSPGERAERAWAAGCDLALHCSGEIADAHAVLEAAPQAKPGLRARLVPPAPDPLDVDALAAERDGLFA